MRKKIERSVACFPWPGNKGKDFEDSVQRRTSTTFVAIGCMKALLASSMDGRKNSAHSKKKNGKTSHLISAKNITSLIQ